MKLFSALFLILFLLACKDTGVEDVGEVSQFRLLSFSPPMFSVVDSSSTLSATFDWDLNVLEFYPDEYFVRFVFEGHVKDDFRWPKTYVFTDMFDIKSVRGSGTLNYPVEKIWNDTGIRRPLRVRVELLAKVSATIIRSLEQSGTIRYNE